ncbi:MAG: DUF2071 domain-containing protein [Bacteroidetes bacterium]|nr:DUF2071 domain-containing protein [Bacteroidota bacterium]
MKQKPVFLTAFWKNLIMANYEISPDALTEFVPAKTELDYFNSKCYISLVGFMFLDTKIMGMKIPFHTNFEEVNLRFYVKYKSGNEWKRGVTFIKEIVPKFFIELVANNIYSEKYDSMPMKNELSIHDGKINTGYFWQHNNNWNFIKAETEKESFLAAENSEEEFITEHYWGYTKVSDSKTSEYEVEHPKWKLHNVSRYEVNCDFSNLYGKRFSFLQNQKPSSVFLAEGSEVIVRKGSNI